MTSATSVRRLLSNPHTLSIEWAEGEVSEFASVWLRDNRREDRDPHSGQRLTDIVDSPEDPRIRSAVVDSDAVNVEWEGEPRRDSFDLQWLRAHASTDGPAQPFARRLWLEGARLDATRDFGWATFSDVQTDTALRADWLTRLLQDGIAFLGGMPARDGGILEAAALAGRILETNYGSVFDVRSVPQPENLAYSDLGLGLHTDNPYREPVPGFQALHAWVTSPAGGDSIFADGAALAEHLRAVDPGDFAILTQTAVPFLYRTKDAELYAERPLIQLSCAGEVMAVHYNSRSIAPLRLAAKKLPAFYGAYRRFAGLLRETQFQVHLRLRDGDLVMFDNQRILHGRSAFSSAQHRRHLRGCYLSRDSVYSTVALLRRGLDSDAASSGYCGAATGTRDHPMPRSSG